MAKLFERVNPGDLITSGYLNGILDTIEKLDVRIAQLETAVPTDNRVVISDIDPSSGPYIVGQEMKILGKNFEYSIGAHRLYFDGTNVDIFKQGSSNTKLIFDIPEIPNIPIFGKVTLITLSNRSSTDSRTITLMPKKEPLAGNITVESYHTVEEGTITAGKPATFKFKAISGVNQPAKFIITPFILIDTNQQQWQDRLRVLNRNKELISTKEITLSNGELQDFYVRITSIPNGTDGTNFGLTVDVTTENIKGSSLLENYTVGSPPEQEDTSIHLNISSIVDPKNHNAPLPPEDYISITKTVKRAIGQVAKIGVTTVFDAPGDYVVSVSLVEGDHWSVHLITPIPTGGESGEYNGITAGTAKIPEFGVGPDVGASTSGKVRFSIKRKDLAYGRPLLLNLTLKQ